MFQVFKLV